MVDAGIPNYLLHIGACRPRRDGSDFIKSAGAVSAVNAEECTHACTAQGDVCKSALWFLGGNTTFQQVSSQCWLSSTCTVPNCCHDAFDTHVKTQYVKPTPPHAPPKIIDGFETMVGACRSGQATYVANSAAREARSPEVCARACRQHGDECVAAMWYRARGHAAENRLQGKTAELVRRDKSMRQCWLSRACVQPDCCEDTFTMMVKAGHVRASPPPPPPPIVSFNGGSELLSEPTIGSPALTCDGWGVRDGAWVGVLRMAPSLQETFFRGPHAPAPRQCDGRCHGYGDTGGYAKISHDPDEHPHKLVNYGCCALAWP